MTRKEAAEILEEVKLNDDSMYAYSEPYMTALDMAIGTLKARETSLEKVAADYGLMPDGVAFALEQYQKVLCDITHNRLSKPTYYADDIIRLVHDVQCDGCELIEPRVMTLKELVAWQKQPIMARDPIYVEYRDGKGFGAPHWAMDNFGFDVASCRDNYRSGVYGILLRCWTSRPTDEQRKATPWK